MSQETNKLFAQQDELLPAAPAPNGLAERILRLFAATDEASAIERADEARVARIAQKLLRDKTVSSGVDPRTLAERFKGSRIPWEPSDFADYLDYLDRNVVAHSMRTSSPLFIGHMTSALPYFARPLTELMTAMNQNQVKLETSKALSLYERQSVAMVHRLIYDLGDDFYSQHIQHPDSTLGVITSGGTLANITALWCARNARLGPRGSFRGVEYDGLPAALEHYGYSGAVVIGSNLMHYSFEKAASTLGLGMGSLIKAPVNKQHQIDLAALEDVVARCQANKQCVIAIIGIAGTTDSGAVDPLPGLAEMARLTGANFHVDAAWGGPLLFSARHRHKLAGIEQAASVTIDGHKQMYLPMGIGMVMLRDPRLAQTIEKQARYIVRAGSYDLGRRSLEGSRPLMSLLLHAALHILGRNGYEFLIDEGIRKAQYMAQLIRTRPEFEVLVEPAMNIITYRFIPASFRKRAASGKLSSSDHELINLANERLQKRQRRIGQTFVSRTMFDTTRYGTNLPIVTLRAVIANPLTTEKDIEAVLDHQVDIASNLS